MGPGEGEGARSSLRALTRLVPVKLRVEVLPRVEGHLDLFSHRQPLSGDRPPQVPGQGRSEAQAAGRQGEGAAGPAPLAPRVRAAAQGSRVLLVLDQDVGVHGVVDP